MAAASALPIAATELRWSPPTGQAPGASPRTAHSVKTAAFSFNNYEVPISSLDLAQSVTRGSGHDGGRARARRHGCGQPRAFRQVLRRGRGRARTRGVGRPEPRRHHEAARGRSVQRGRRRARGSRGGRVIQEEGAGGRRGRGLRRRGARAKPRRRGRDQAHPGARRAQDGRDRQGARRGAPPRSPRAARHDARGGVQAHPGRRPQGAQGSHRVHAPRNPALPPRRVLSVHRHRGAQGHSANGAGAPQAGALLLPQANLTKRRALPAAARGGPTAVLGTTGRASEAAHHPGAPRVRGRDGDGDA